MRFQRSIREGGVEFPGRLFAMGARASVLLLLLSPAVVQAAEEPEPRTDFIRLRELSPGKAVLETAVVTYSKAGGASVDLISAVHIGDVAYYRELQKRFGAYESLLYEMIKPDDVVPTPGQPSDNILSMFQRGLKDLLGLEFQLDAIDYRKENFVHADLDPETFFSLQREKGESVLSLVFRMFRAEMELQSKGEAPRSVGVLELIAAFSSVDRASSLKLLLARQIEGMELLMAGFEGDDEESGSVILSERNKKVVQVLQGELEQGKKKIGVFYGGGHMPDLERRLVKDCGFAKTSTRWVIAWDIGGGAAEVQSAAEETPPSEPSEGSRPTEEREEPEPRESKERGEEVRSF